MNNKPKLTSQNKKTARRLLSYVTGVYKDVYKRQVQGQGVGSCIISAIAGFARTCGYQWLRLCFAEGNPQSEAFWIKNQFEATGMVCDHDDYRAVEMIRSL